MLKQLQKTRDQKGFTIIEVLIVLAIAGLIMVIVFLAVPNLQRSQRNNTRKTDANNALSALSDYVSNNGGALPAAACTGTGGCTFLSTYKAGYFDAVNNVKFQTSIAGLPAITAITPDQLFVVGNATCASAAVAPTAGTSTRNVAVYYGIEGGVKSQCISQ
jgi:type IV pilus assembly protein PilA